MTRTTLRVGLLAVLAASTLTACDSSGDDDNGDNNGNPAVGQFEADITGAERQSLEGQAAYAVATEDGETITAVALIDEDDDQDVALVVLKGQPHTGTFSATGDEDAAEAGLILVLSEGEDGTLYASTGGTVTITRASGGELEGRFEIEAINAMDEASAVSFEGTFDAKLGDIGEARGLAAAARR